VGSDANGYLVRIDEVPDDGWRVTVEDPAGVVVMERACADGSEARTFASTVRQHIYWLSPGKFREYYRI
jgi:RPA family protein